MSLSTPRWKFYVHWFVFKSTRNEFPRQRRLLAERFGQLDPPPSCQDSFQVSVCSLLLLRPLSPPSSFFLFDSSLLEPSTSPPRRSFLLLRTLPGPSSELPFRCTFAARPLSSIYRRWSRFVGFFSRPLSCTPSFFLALQCPLSPLLIPRRGTRPITWDPLPFSSVRCSNVSAPRALPFSRLQIDTKQLGFSARSRLTRIPEV